MVRVAFSKLTHATKPRVGPPGANHGPFTAKPSSCHVHSTLWVTPPTSPCPTLSADTELARQRAETIFFAQCTVWHYQKCTIEFKGLTYQYCRTAAAFQPFTHCTSQSAKFKAQTSKLTASMQCSGTHTVRGINQGPHQLSNYSQLTYYFSSEFPNNSQLWKHSMLLVILLWVVYIEGGKDGLGPCNISPRLGLKQSTDITICLTTFWMCFSTSWTPLFSVTSLHVSWEYSLTPSAT